MKDFESVKTKTKYIFNESLASLNYRAQHSDAINQNGYFRLPFRSHLRIDFLVFLESFVGVGLVMSIYILREPNRSKNDRRCQR